MKLHLNKIRRIGFLLISLSLINCFASAQQPADYVNPYIGTGNHGHVFLGANLPFGGVQLGPVNLSEGWDWCSGYNNSDSTIIGFSHTHLSGTGIGDLGDVQIMPTTGPVLLNKGSLKNPGNFSLFNHATEKAIPGYYEVELNRYHIKAALTATTRVGFHQYTFPASEQAHILVDLVQGIGWDRPVEAYIKKVNDSTIVGYRFSKGWAADQRLYFAAVFSKPFKQLQVYDGGRLQTGMVVMGDSIKAVADFNTAAGEIIQLKVGISPVSFSNALLNIQTEIPAWDFDLVKTSAYYEWNKALSKITIEADDNTKQKFYTALYHTKISPATFNDVNGDYYGTDKQVHPKANFTNLTTFSLWDTYRACNELYTLVEPEKVSDMINTMLAIYQQQGRLPVWHLMGNETNTMPGNSAIQVIADAYLKGIRGFDTALAYEAVKATAMSDYRGLPFVKSLGYIPADSMTESVAKGMEYAIGDGCIALVAKRMGLQNDAAYFSARAANYKNYFDSTTQFVEGRLNKNSWRQDFSPFVSRHMKDDFSEGNAWQYTWLAPHDVPGLIQLLGGEKKFIKKLDSLFVVSGDMGKEASNDITGLIGQYAHGNEPSHHITYLYGYTSQPWKTAEKVRFIMDSMYTVKPDGIIGNEDAGQMSAWYVMSALGFYPIHPAGGMYVFGSPAINNAIIKVANNKTFKITVINNSSANKYIQSVTLNGNAYTKTYLQHADIMNGGEVIIKMGSKPSRKWGVANIDKPTL